MGAVIENKIVVPSQRKLSMQTFYKVRCECGHLNRIYALSWGGHGSVRCKGCRYWIRKRDLMVSKERAPAAPNAGTTEGTERR